MTAKQPFALVMHVACNGCEMPLYDHKYTTTMGVISSLQFPEQMSAEVRTQEEKWT